jgi:hypothetical protein
MGHSCEFLCSEIITVTYEDAPGELCQSIANLEEISITRAVVLLDERPRLGSPISLSIHGHDLFGVITSSVYDATLGWFVTITLDVDSTWRPASFSPKHLLSVCACSLEGATRTKVRTLEKAQITEENVPVSILVRQA